MNDRKEKEKAESFVDHVLRLLGPKPSNIREEKKD
jgi:hypothetical protein